MSDKSKDESSECDSPQAMRRRELLKKLGTLSVYTAPAVTTLFTQGAHGHALTENYNTLASCANDPSSANAPGKMNHQDMMNPSGHCMNVHNL